MRYQVGEEPIPGYRLESFLGEGSYGEVWKAIGPGGVTCALKFIRIDSKSGLKELRAVGMVKQLRNPNLVPINAIWLKDPEGNLLGDTLTESVKFQMRANKELIIAMGLGEKSLADRLDECRGKTLPGALPSGMPIKELLRYMSDAARGIDYLNEPVHDMGNGLASIIHCDIKPGNLLIVGGGVQVCDYGVARALAVDPGSQAKKTLAAGTPAYAPAELIMNEPCSATDQYSLAITYFELRTGRLPFEEHQAMAKNLTGDLDFSALPSGEREVLHQAASKKTGDRFPNCADFVDALSSVVPRGATASGPIRAGSGPFRSDGGGRRSSKVLDLEFAGKAFDPKVGTTIAGGLTLAQPLGKESEGNLWEARGPGGNTYALKIVRNNGVHMVDLSSLEQVARLRHDHLVPFRGHWVLAGDGTEIPIDRAIRGSGSLLPQAVVVTADLFKKSLSTLLQEYRRRGQPGIPAEELLNLLRQAALALDYLNLDNNIQHRDITPDNLFLQDGSVFVGNFGLVRLANEDRTLRVGEWMDFAAPEVLDHRISSRADEFSLAAVYYYLRTGTPPFPPVHQASDGAGARISGRYDLSGVTPGEASILARSMSPNAADRFGGNVEMIRQLAASQGIGSGVVQTPAERHSLPEDRYKPPVSYVRDQPVVGSTGVPWSEAQRRVPASNLATSPRQEPDPVPLEMTSPHRPTPNENNWGGTMQFPPGTGGNSGPQPSLVPPPPQPAPSKTVANSDPRRTRQADIEPIPKSKSGMLIAIVLGMFVLFGAVGGGVFFLTKQKAGGGGDSENHTAEIVELQKKFDRYVAVKDREQAQKVIEEVRPLDAKLADTWTANLPATDPTKPDPDPIPPNRADELEKAVRDLILAGSINEARATQSELARLDAARAANLDRYFPKTPPTTVDPPPPTDPFVKVREELFKQAQAAFQAKKIDEGLTRLDSLNAKSPTPSERMRSDDLRTAWSLVKNATAFPVTNAAQLMEFDTKYGAQLRAVNLQVATDNSELKSTARQLLTSKIQSAVPGLNSKTDWARLAFLAKNHAEQLPWIQALLVECWTELARAKADPKIDGASFTPLSDRELQDLAKAASDPNLSGYIAYVSTIRAATEAIRKPASAPDAAQLVRSPFALKDGAKPAWLNADRTWALWKDFQQLLEAAQATGSKIPPELLDTTVFDRLAEPSFAKLFDSTDDETRKLIAGVYQRGGLMLRLTSDSANRVSTLFEEGKRFGDSATFTAWKAIVESENSRPDVEKLDAARLLVAKDNPKLATLLEAMRDSAKAGQESDSSKQLETRRSVANLLTKSVRTFEQDGANSSDLLVVAMQVAAENDLATARLESAHPAAMKNALASARSIADKLHARLPNRAATKMLRASVIEQQSWLLKPAARFDPIAVSSYPVAEEIYVSIPQLQQHPQALLGLGRTKVKHAEDAYQGKVTATIDTKSLEQADSSIQDAIKLVANRDPGLVAECKYWLGTSMMLKYQSLADSNELKEQYYKDSLKYFNEATALSKTPEATFWSRQAAQSVLQLYTLEGQRTVRGDKTQDGEAIAALLDQLGGNADSVLGKVERAKARMEAVQLRADLKDDHSEKLVSNLAKAFQDGGGDCPESDLPLQLELRMLIANTALSHSRSKDFEEKFYPGMMTEAIDVLEPGTENLPSSIFSVSSRGTAVGTLGLLYFERGKSDEKARAASYKLATTQFQDALKLVAGTSQPDAWRWDFAFGYIRLSNATDGKGVGRGNLAAEAMHYFHRAIVQIRQIRKEEATKSTEENRQFADYVYNQNLYLAVTGCTKFLEAALKDHSDDQSVSLWKLAVADANCALTGQYKSGTEQRTAIDKALKRAKGDVENLPTKELKSFANEYIAEIETRLKAYPAD